MGTRNTAAAACLVLALVGTACSRGGDPTVDDEPTPVPSDKRGATTTTATTIPIDVSTIPTRIDEPYINAVLAALDQVDAQATKLIVANKRITPPAAQYLLAIYNTEELDEQTQVWETTINKGFKNVRADPGARKTTVTRFISSSPTCIFVEVEQDFSATAINVGSPTAAYVMLIPLDRSRDAHHLNPTPWMIHTEGSSSDKSDPGDLCAG